VIFSSFAIHSAWLIPPTRLHSPRLQCSSNVRLILTLGLLTDHLGPDCPSCSRTVKGNNSARGVGHFLSQRISKKPNSRTEKFQLSLAWIRNYSGKTSWRSECNHELITNLDWMSSHKGSMVRKRSK